MAENRRLGRGLSSLIPSGDEQTNTDQGVRDVPIRRIELNPEQPRAEIDPEELRKLADSIRSSGVIQPVLVRPGPEDSAGYELVVGERRVRAARLAGLEEIPAVVREVSDDQMLEMALVENIQRSDLNAIEKARAIGRMIGELELTQQEAGRRLGLDRSTISNLLRLLELPEEVQGMVSRETLTAGHARALLAVDSVELMKALAQKVAEEGLSVRATERLVSGRSGRGHSDRVRRPSPHLVEMEEALSRALGTRVQVKPLKRKGGKIVIRFKDNEDFERLFEQITGGPTETYPERVPA